jgi:hypothetical protein
MGLVKFETGSVPVIEEETGLVKWAPGIRFEKDGDFILMAHQGSVVHYDTKEECDKHFEEE